MKIVEREESLYSLADKGTTYAEQQHLYKITSKFNLSANEYQELLQLQGNVCAICKQECTTGRRLCVDHNHQTKKVRGLLCVNCNNGIGRFKDNVDLLDAATTYVRESNGLR